MGSSVVFKLASLKHVLLDIEGTVSDIRFVFNVMFPYAKMHMDSYLERHWGDEAVKEAVSQVAKDAGVPAEAWQSSDSASDIASVASHLQELMAQDSKATGLKGLQGLVWKEGFESGELVAELFSDVLPAIDSWIGQGLKVSIYSSGSVLAQKLFFGYTTQGDLTGRLTSFFDTTTGKKQESASYQKIAEALGVPSGEVLFVSDVAAELTAGMDAGMQVVASVREGNKPLEDSYQGARVTSFAQIAME